MNTKKRKAANPALREDDVMIGRGGQKPDKVAFIGDPRTLRKWEWLERDQPGLYDFLRDFIRRWHQPAVTGRSVSDGGRKGLEIAHGQVAERRARWSKYQDFINDEKLQNSSLTITDRRKLAAKHFNVSLKTITRRTK